ncbi:MULTISPECIES: YgaP family membrane protein [Paracoccus]|jgi:cytochrome b subunit of formate dehydrogenase|uniref:Putative transmembrane protein n=1 Tax=Paracoccus denitrificans (strain Pd 1222) TaxID=318586 RepID=A1BB72_PARDP|nr:MULTISPECIES: DUF2892 domain-containing protein [Paracoccus]ABL72766.1 putative transmembrane protein [Paracoccus denitrificans PD1222]MBB4626244.1 cytochrome b subunit of formate dehydrogenase [Paracoccus denitrificans]MCU7427549.1 DUF2892 domain-containing protein [Paracoccus denitrificans]MDK8871095.1 DUF2892 domain-containing protein [Paracoccus sp. SSJ]QAR29728.1 DUF2892 domain-containing protein [Paracoccus denitrificans]
MQINIGSAERALRLILGIVLVALPFLAGLSALWTWVSVIVGLVLVVTGVVRFCPIWALLGIRTGGRE